MTDIEVYLFSAIASSANSVRFEICVSWSLNRFLRNFRLVFSCGFENVSDFLFSLFLSEFDVSCLLFESFELFEEFLVLHFWSPGVSQPRLLRC